MQDKIEQFQNTRLAGLIDPSTSPNQAILIAPARDINPALVNQMIQLGKGNIFAALSPRRVDELLLEDMRPHSSRHPSPSSSLARACVSVEAREGVTTGISASDRATTLRVLGDEVPNPRKLVKPGHIFPVRTRAGGSLVKFALPEGAHDLVSLSFNADGAAYIDVLNDQGELCSSDEVEKICGEKGLPLFRLDELVRYRLEHEPLVKLVAEAKLPTTIAGEVRSYVYQSLIFEGEHIALVKGTITPDKPVLVRVQSEFTFGDVFGGSTPPTRSQLQEALRVIGNAERGVLLYLRRTDPDSLTAQVEDWSAAFRRPTATAMREYGVGAQILRDLGVSKIELLTGSSQRLEGLSPFGIEITKQVPLVPGSAREEVSQ